MGVYDQIEKAFQDIIAPELHALRGDIRLLDQKIDGLDQKIDAVDARLTVKIDAVRNEMIAEIRRVDTRIEGVDRELRTAIDIRERLAALEARHPAGVGEELQDLLARGEALPGHLGQDEERPRGGVPGP